MGTALMTGFARHQEIFFMKFVRVKMKRDIDINFLRCLFAQDCCGFWMKFNCLNQLKYKTESWYE